MWPFSRKNEERASIENPSVPISSAAITQILDWGVKSAAGVNVTPEKAMECPPVWAAVNFISSSIAGLPLNVFRETGEGREKAADGIQRILHDAPNDEMTSFQWRKSMMQDVMLYGRSATLILRDGRGQVARLRRFNPNNLQVEMRDNRKFYTYKPSDSSETYRYSAAEIIDVVWSMMSDGVSVRSPIHSARDAIGLYLAMEDYASKVFQNGGVPPLALVGPTNTAEGAKRASEDITREIMRANEDQRLVLTLPAGFELKNVGFDPEKMQMEEARQFQLGEIARIFGLPKVFLQDLTGATYSNTEQQDLHFVKHTLTGWLEAIEQELNLKLFSGRGDKRFAEFNVDGLLRGDFKTRMDGYATAIQNAISTPNEVRRKENMPDHQEGDDLLIQGATVPLGSQPVKPTTEPAMPDAEGSDAETE